MPFHVTGNGGTSAAAVRVAQVLSGSVEAWIQAGPGSPPVYIGPNSGVGVGNGWYLVDGGPPLNMKVRAGDEIWAFGTDPIIASDVTVLFRTV